MSLPLTPEQIQQRYEQATAVVGVPQELAEPTWARPMTTTVNDYVTAATNSGNRYMFGIDRLDMMVRGIGRGELMIVTGRAFSSKTQLLLNSLLNNLDKRVLWVTPDEVAELIMLKLATMHLQIDPLQMEAGVKNKDPEYLGMLQDFASTTMPNLMVVDRTPTVSQMYEALDEAEDWWGMPADLVVFDYLELLPGEGDARGVARKADELKQFGKERMVPMAVVHQSGRSGDRGRAAGMDGMKYGGEQQATFVLEVYRKRQDEALSEAGREAHENTATINVAKNKRLPCTTGELDLFLDPRFGVMRQMLDGDPGTPLQGRKQMGYGGTMPDPIRTMSEEDSDAYRQRMGYQPIHDTSAAARWEKDSF